MSDDELNLNNVPRELRPQLDELRLLVDEAADAGPEAQAEVRKLLAELAQRLLRLSKLCN